MRRLFLGLLLFATSAGARVQLATVPAGPFPPGGTFVVVGCGFNRASARLYGDARGATSWDDLVYLFDVEGNGCIRPGDSPTFTASSTPGTYTVAVCQRNVTNTDPCKFDGSATITVH